MPRSSFDFDVAPGALWIEAPIDVLLSDLSVIFVGYPLQKIEDQTFVQIWTARCIVDV